MDARVCVCVIVTLCIGVCLWKCVSLFSCRAHVFHVTKCASNKPGHGAARELLD